MASRQGLFNRLKKLEQQRGQAALGQWLIVGVREQGADENEEKYAALLQTAIGEAQAKGAQPGTILMAPLDFWRDPRDPPLPASVHDKGYTYQGDNDLDGQQR